MCPYLGLLVIMYCSKSSGPRMEFITVRAVSVLNEKWLPFLQCCPICITTQYRNEESGFNISVICVKLREAQVGLELFPSVNFSRGFKKDIQRGVLFYAGVAQGMPESSMWGNGGFYLSLPPSQLLEGHTGVSVLGHASALNSTLWLVTNFLQEFMQVAYASFLKLPTNDFFFQRAVLVLDTSNWKAGGLDKEMTCFEVSNTLLYMD